MALAPLVWETMKEWKTKTLALDIPEVIELAKEIAFYTAMINAAEDDPLDDSEDQEEILQYFRTTLHEKLEAYMNLVNEAL